MRPRSVGRVQRGQPKATPRAAGRARPRGKSRGPQPVARFPPLDGSQRSGSCLEVARGPARLSRLSEQRPRAGGANRTLGWRARTLSAARPCPVHDPLGKDRNERALRSQHRADRHGRGRASFQHGYLLRFSFDAYGVSCRASAESSRFAGWQAPWRFAPTTWFPRSLRRRSPKRFGN
jgi:hypothetical protein